MTKLPTYAPGTRRLCQSGERRGPGALSCDTLRLGLAELLKKAQILELRKLFEAAYNRRTSGRISVGLGLSNDGIREGDVDLRLKRPELTSECPSTASRRRKTIGKKAVVQGISLFASES